MVDRWSSVYPSCVKCGTVDVKHHARGLCRSCYSVNRARTKGRWPAGLASCSACGCDTSNAYRSIGLCRRCHRRADRVGVIVFWRLIYLIRKAKQGEGGREVLVSIIRTVGLSATARIIDKERSEVHELALGDKTMDKETADRIEAAFLRVFKQ